MGLRGGVWRMGAGKFTLSPPFAEPDSVTQIRHTSLQETGTDGKPPQESLRRKSLT